MFSWNSSAFIGLLFECSCLGRSGVKFRQKVCLILGFEMTLMSHLLVAAVLDERGEAYWDCTAPVSFELKK